MAYDLKEMRVPVGDLRLGMHVLRLDRPWEETDFLLQGFVINHREEIDALQAQCEHVFIEAKVHMGDIASERLSIDPAADLYNRSETGGGAVARGKKAGDQYKERHAVGKPTTRVTYINKIDVSKEMVTARSAYDQARGMARDIMANIRLGKTLDMHQAREVVDECVSSVLRNGDALLLLTKLKEQHEYTAEHCMNVCILTATFARHLGMLEEEIRKIALCGLLHDVGKSRIPDAVLNKPSALTPEEYKLMQNHAALGRDVLMASPRVEHSCVDVAYNHHERPDGNGYPRGLPATQIPYWAKIVAIVDAYDAITSNRNYDKGRASMEALDIIHRGKGKQFDEELANEFIRCIGIYPPGSIILLSSGEVGIVVAANPKNKLKPRVLLVRNEQQGKREKYRMIDLIQSPADSRGNPYAITKEVPDGTFGVSLRNFLERGLVLGAPTVYED